MRRLEWALFLGMAMLASGACGDDESGSGGSGATSSSSSSSASGTTTSSSASGSGGGGGAGGSMETSVNGCTVTAAEDHTADATTTITSTGFAYGPKCIRIKAGSSVVFNSDFVAHPLVGGSYANMTKTPDPASPIKTQTAGTTATFTFPSAGDFGYYCDAHASFGMIGAIFVE